MDKQSIIEAIYYGLPKPSESFLPQQSWAYNPDLPKHEYNPEKAKQILDEAGWQPGSDGVREKNGVQARVPQLHHRRQPRPRAGAAVPPAELAGHRRQDDDQQSAAGRDVGRLLDAVEVRDGDGRHRLHDRPGPGRQRLLRQRSRSAPRVAPGRTPASTAAPRSTSCCRRGQARSTGRSAPRSTAGCRRSTRRDLPYLPIFQYAQVEGTKAGLQGFKPNIYVQMNTYNCNQWYWAT